MSDTESENWLRIELVFIFWTKQVSIFLTLKCPISPLYCAWLALIFLDRSSSNYSKTYAPYDELVGAPSLGKIINCIFIYRTRVIITRSWFETAFDCKPWSFGSKIENFPYLAHKLPLILTALQYKQQWYKLQNNEKFALNSQLQTNQVLTNDDQMAILCLSYFLTTVTG